MKDLVVHLQSPRDTSWLTKSEVGFLLKIKEALIDPASGKEADTYIEKLTDDLRELIHESKMREPGYERLRDVLILAYEQAASGKGKERHAGKGIPFHEQPMASINREQGSIDGFLYQARKKSLESKRLPNDRAIAEILGAINYLAGAVIALQSWAYGTTGPQPVQEESDEA